MTGKVLTLDRRLEDTLLYLSALVGVDEAAAALAQSTLRCAVAAPLRPSRGCCCGKA